MNTTQLKNIIMNGELNEKLIALYGEAALSMQTARYLKAIDSFASIYGDFDNVGIYSVPGRSELSGNHTDHNAGCVIASSIDLDVIAVAARVDGTVIRIKSEGYPEDVVDISVYTQPDSSRFATSGAIIAGMSEGLTKQGYASGGFVAYTTSNVLKGSGLSSSAAFEVMVGNLISHLYNDGKIDNVEIAKTAQYAENQFFGKPCGLMDQVACANGGIVAIDFAEAGKPVIEPVAFDISGAGYALCITDTGGNHADLTDDYAAVPAEMKAVAKALGADLLRRTSKEELLENIEKVRSECGDRAVLRALHFFNENERVAKQKAALLDGDVDKFFTYVIESGRSSFCYLQNVYTTKNVSEQGLSLALCLAEGYMSGKKGAFRVHGGGFAGTVQAFVALPDVEGFRALMDSAFGEGKCMVLRVRQQGAVKVID
jgi:galactokinase